MDDACRKILGENSKPAKFDKQIWSGIGFRIFKDELVIQNIYIDEILDTNIQNSLSSVPGAKPWFLGLTSLRGQPLSIIDLKQYLFNKPTTLMKSSRLVVVKSNNQIFGLLLEEVFGLSQFPVHLEEEKQIDYFSKEIKPFIDTTFNDNGVVRGNFSIPALIKNKEFSNAAR